LSNKSAPSLPYTNNASLKLRYMTVELFNDGKSRTEIAKILSASRRLVNEWITKYLSGGVDALALKKSTGRAPQLSLEEKEQLKSYVIPKLPGNAGFQREFKWSNTRHLLKIMVIPLSK
jgi:putative transposase